LSATDRRTAFGQIASAAAFVALAPGAAQADGAVSMATKTKAKFIYGGRIADLKSAVAAGDFDAVAAEKNAFILFNSGVYSSAKDKPSKAKAIEGTNAIFSAIRSKDKSALKSAYDAYVASNTITPIPAISNSEGQSLASDFSYVAKTKAS
jgi:Photosystem II Psb31 protein